MKFVDNKHKKNKVFFFFFKKTNLEDSHFPVAKLTTKLQITVIHVWK